MRYGYRARIGYTSPPASTEVFPYEFHAVVPKGVTLVLTTLAIADLTPEEVAESYEISVRAAGEMARTGIDLMVMGGVPINLSRGYDNVDDLIRDTRAKIGIPVTTSVTAQLDALRTTGARRIATGHPFGADQDQLFVDMVERSQARAPDADTVWLPCPHWACGEAIDDIEGELGVTVVTANQAITWHALRRCGIDDRITGAGRLLVEF